jgi:hypothetical protein
MGTQGVFSLVDGRRRTILKVVVGCNGQAVEAFAARIMDLLTNEIEDADDLSVERAVAEALKVDFGCEDCLVAQKSRRRILAKGYPDDWDKKGTERYLRHFVDPWFNPRWKRGTAPYVVVLQV